MTVGPAQGHAERRAARVDDEVPLAARLAAIRRVWAGVLAPLFAGTLALSSAARDQSSCLAPASRSSKARCRAAQTPALCHSCNLRQQLIPEPQPILAGRYSHGSPVLSTNRMPVSDARSGMGGLPPLGLGRSGGSKGAITAHKSSGTSSLAMTARTRQSRFR